MKWVIKRYEAKNGKSDVRSYYDKASIAVQANFDSAVEYLSSMPRTDWQRPKAARLTKGNKYRHYYEIRIFADKVPHRPIGYFGPNDNDFTILIWAIEKGNKLLPTTWAKTADRLRNQIEEGNANAIKFDKTIN